MASLSYNRHKQRLVNGDFAPAGTLRMLLTQSGYTPDQDHNTVNDITNEVTTTGYSRQTLANVVVSEDDANDRASFTSDSVDFGNIGDSTQTAAWAVIFERIGGADAATDPLVCALDITDTLLDGAGLIVQPHSNGWETVS